MQGRKLSGSSFSNRIETDLVRYDRIIRIGLKAISQLLFADEVLYLAQKLYGQPVDNQSLSLWLSLGLQHLAYDPMAEDVFDETFKINRNDLKEKIEKLSIMEKIALIEYLEQLFQVEGNKAKKDSVYNTFVGGHNVQV